ncbi:SURF1 family protein [Shewanella salipaludis]|uniref:SURF1-like protein n=1 Tax=Shewanella salipaludis TaxID=2723052 RepID=A0A972JIH5_9GAMM|nr:SURF1 family protein [Shewanella salipaludis]
MNPSSSTKSTLKTNRVFTDIPRKLPGNFSWLIVLITVSLFMLLVKLGFWQLARAEEKALLQQQLLTRQAAAPLDYRTLISGAEPEPTGYRLRVTAGPALAHVFLLDNQVYLGKVGYLAYQAMEVEPGLPWLLLELGFVEAGPRRDELPRLSPLRGRLKLAGRLYRKQANPMSRALMAESGWPMRLQNLNLPELAQLLNHELAPAVLQPELLPGLTLPHPWQPIPMSAQKHRGYAMQWFSMAAALACLGLWLIIRIKKQRHGS